MQDAIEKIGKEVNGLTILIIAHRVTTIASANNLLFFRSRSHLDYTAKGTRQYNEIFETIKNIAYSLGDESAEKEVVNEDSSSDMEIQEEELDNLIKTDPSQNTLTHSNNTESSDDGDRIIIPPKKVFQEDAHIS